jgi:hypothetical protein
MSLSSVFGSGAVGMGVAGASAQSSGTVTIGAVEGARPQTSPSASLAAVAGASTSARVMATVDVTATVTRTVRLGQAAAGIPWLLGGMIAVADSNTVEALLSGPRSDTCYGSCTCSGVSGNLCMGGGSEQDGMRMASPPLAGASESGTPSGPPEDGGDREVTPATDRNQFESVRRSDAKRNRETGEYWRPDRLHKDHYEVYRNQRELERGLRDRSVWNDGRLKEVLREWK